MKLSKNFKLDFIRALAILLVVFIHAAAYINEKVGLSYMALSFSFGIGRVGVPLFFLLTGYLMLDRDYEKNFGPNSDYYRRRFFPLLLKCLLGMLFLSFIIMMTTNNYDMFQLIRQLLFIEFQPGVQTWYIPVIILIYFIMPYLALIFQTTSNMMLLFTMIPIIIYVMILNDVNIVLSRSNLQPYYSQFLINDIPIYIMYMYFGGMIKRGILKKAPSLLLIFCQLILLVGLFWIQMYSYEKNMPFVPWYNSFLVFSNSILLFIILLRIPFMRQIKSIRIIADASFGIYWIHTVTQPYLIEVFNFVNSNTLKLALFTSTNLLICTFIIILGMRATNKIKLMK